MPSMTTGAGVSIREMTIEDIPAGLALCRAAGWNQRDADWRHFLARNPHGALVAVERGSVVGTVATLPYGAFTWISMVLVDPAARGRGIGTTLLHRGLALVPEGVTPRLDATPAGEPIYRALGFVGEYGIERWSLARAHGGPAKKTGARRLEPSDWTAMCEMDLHAFGASRASLLQQLAEDAPEYGWVLESERGIRGYLFGRHGHVREHLGPLVASDQDAACTLLASGLAAVGDRGCFVDVPDDQQAFRTFLLAEGFAVQRPFLRMHRGELTARGNPSSIFAIAGPEFG